MRKNIVIVIALALVVSLPACGGDDDDLESATTVLTDTGEAAETGEELLETAEEALEDALTRDLEEQNSSGISGTVELEPVDQEELRVVIQLTGSPEGASHPAHVHAGTCDDLDPTPAYPLENVVNGRSETTLKASALEVLTGEFAVNVHESNENPGRYVACGNIVATE